MKYTVRKGDKHMNKLIYEYFTSTSAYSGSHSKVKKHQLKISRYNISKYAILNGKYNGRKMSYDTKGFYSSICKMAIKKKNGYCPCRLEMNQHTKCMCKEFREQIADENFEGYCHCMLYYKEK